MILLALQLAIIPMTMDSIGATLDSVVFQVAWSVDTTKSPVHPARPDSLRLYWQRALTAVRSRKLPARVLPLDETTVRFPQRKGPETTLRIVCLRYWRATIATLRCIGRDTRYVYRLDLKPDSATLTASSPP